MPGFKSILRALAAAALLFAYYELPRRLEKRAGAPVIAVTPSDVTGLTITGLGEQPVSISRADAGKWVFDGFSGTYADSAQIGCFLSGLATANCKVPESQGNVPADAPTVTLKRASGETMAIRLGPRLTALKRQLISVDGKTLDVDRDLSACLGFWQRETAPSPDQLLQKTLVQLDGREIKRIELSNPVAAHDFVRTPQTFSIQRSPNLPAETAHIWREQSEHTDKTVFSAGLHDYCKDLGMLTVARLATPAETTPALKFPYSVRCEISDGSAFAFAVSGPFGDNRSRSHLLRMVDPPSSGLFVIGPVAFRNLVPSGATLFENVPVISTGAESATEVMYERDGHQCVMVKRGDEWQVTTPRLPYKVYTPPAEMPGDIPVSMAEGYIVSLRQFATREIFEATTPERQQLLADGLRQPAARATLKLAGGSSVAIAVSPPIEGTEMVFVAIGRAVVIAGRGAIRQVAPDITRFFDPEDVKDKEVRW